MPEESSHNPPEAAARPACSTCLQGATRGEAETRGGEKKRGGRKVQYAVLHHSSVCAVLGFGLNSLFFEAVLDQVILETFASFAKRRM